jgi:hypothetical protein
VREEGAEGGKVGELQQCERLERESSQAGLVTPCYVALSFKSFLGQTNTKGRAPRRAHRARRLGKTNT